jgi:hypothetical protein
MHQNAPIGKDRRLIWRLEGPDQDFDALSEQEILGIGIYFACKSGDI